MPRPIKWRRVGFVPEATFFKPVGIPLRAFEEVSLSVEELEAVRLKDQEGLQQEECAWRMDVSRPTFHRVLSSARGKIAEALTCGKAIRIEGGNFEMVRRRLRCGHDGHEWEIPFSEVIDESVRVCPVCNTPNARLLPLRGQGRFGGRGQGRGRRGQR